MKQLEAEIQEMIKQLPEEGLYNLHDYLSKETGLNNAKRKETYEDRARQIIIERAGLLKRLAK